MTTLEAQPELLLENVVYGGCLQQLLTLVHQKTKVCAVAVAAVDDFELVEERWM